MIGTIRLPPPHVAITTLTGDFCAYRMGRAEARIGVTDVSIDLRHTEAFKAIRDGRPCAVGVQTVPHPLYFELEADAIVSKIPRLVLGLGAARGAGEGERDLMVRDMPLDARRWGRDVGAGLDLFRIPEARAVTLYVTVPAILFVHVTVLFDLEQVAYV